MTEKEASAREAGSGASRAGQEGTEPSPMLSQRKKSCWEERRGNYRRRGGALHARRSRRLGKNRILW